MVKIASPSSASMTKNKKKPKKKSYIPNFLLLFPICLLKTSYFSPKNMVPFPHFLRSKRSSRSKKMIWNLQNFPQKKPKAEEKHQKPNFSAIDSYDLDRNRKIQIVFVNKS